MPKQTRKTKPADDAQTAAMLREMLAQARTQPVKRTRNVPPPLRRPRGPH